MLAILFAFLKDLVQLDSSIYRPVLYASLTSLAFTVAVVILSFQLSIRALEQVRSYWKEHYDGNYQHLFPDKLGKWVRYINWAAGISFIMGISLAVAFILVNLSHQAATKESPIVRTKIEEGYVPKSPMIIKSEERGSTIKSPVQSSPKVSTPQEKPSNQQGSSSKK